MVSPVNSLFQPSPGESLPDELKKPYLLLGDPANEATRNKIQEGADLLRPPYSLDPTSEDSFTAQNGVPEGFDEPPGSLDRKVFLEWPSQVQLEYIYKNLLPPNTEGIDGVLVIGAGGSSVAVMISPPPSQGSNVSNPGNAAKVVNISALTASSFSQLSQGANGDRARVLSAGNYPSGFNIFTEVVAPALNLTTDQAALTSDPQSPVTQLQALQTALAQDPPDNFTLIAQLQELAGDPDDPNSGSAIPGVKENAQAALDVIEQQLEIFFNQLDGAGLYDKAAIDSAAKELFDRIDRMNKFAAPLAEVDVPPLPAYPDELDEDAISAQTPEARLASFSASFRNFVNAERAYTTALVAANDITTGVARDELGRRLDGPGLFAAFIFNASLKLQALNQGDTEEFNQLNALVKSYGVIQKMINDVLKNFSDDTKEKRSLSGEKGTVNLADLNLSPEERAALSMFFGKLAPTQIRDQDNNVIWENGEFVDGILEIVPSPELQALVDSLVNLPITKHPLESDVERPGLDLATSIVVTVNIAEYESIGGNDLLAHLDGDGNPHYDSITLGEFNRQQWATRLEQMNSAVTLLNQNSQLAFNEITTRSQQRTTFFEAASNALAKGQDVLQSITRNIA